MAPFEPPPLSKDPPAQAARVLLVDDSRAILAIMEIALARAGFEVEHATDPLEALDRLHRCRFDALVTDLEMPGIDGFELVRRVREVPGLVGLPVILHSACEEKLLRGRLAGAGADAYLPKTAPDALRHLVESVELLVESAREWPR